MVDNDQREFSKKIIEQIKKNGFPDKCVSFSAQKLYDFAYNKGVHLNRVLEMLHEIQIGNVRDGEKIIFYPRDKMPPPVAASSNATEDLASKFGHFVDPSLLGQLSGLDLKNLSFSDLKQMATKMLDNLSPEQKQDLFKSVENMSPEQKKSIFEKVSKLDSENKNKD